MRKISRGFTIVDSIVAVIVLLGTGGYIANIVKLISALPETFASMTMILVLRIIGVFAVPLGAILGFF